MACMLVAGASADVRVDFRETTWSVRAQPPEQTGLIRSWVSDGKRRIESEGFLQIDRIDLDSSFVVLPRDSLFGAVPFERSRQMNRTALESLARARSAGAGPADTLAPVKVTPLDRPRTFFGVACKAYELELSFEYRDSIPGSPGLRTRGLLTDTVWIAPLESPLGEMARFERTFAHATLSDSFLAGANAVELSQARNQGLIAVLRREARKLPGFTVASHYRNVILGLPKGMSGVERTPEGAVVVQRSVREAIRFDTAPIDAMTFEIPQGYKRDVAGESRTPERK